MKVLPTSRNLLISYLVCLEACRVNVRGEKVRCSTVEYYKVMDRNKADCFEETRVPRKKLACS